MWKAVVVGQDTEPKPRKRVAQAKKARGDVAALVGVHEEGK